MPVIEILGRERSNYLSHAGWRRGVKDRCFLEGENVQKPGVSICPMSFERSGLSGTKYAELIEVKYQTFATWLQKRKRERGAYMKV